MAGNATRWYATREAVKAAVGVKGASLNSVLDEYIEAASSDVEQLLTSRGAGGARFIPVTETRLYRWPQTAGRSSVLYLDQDLLAVTTLQAKAQDASPTTIASADYFLEPANDPPYRRIEIDQSSSAAFASGDTRQRSISVAGRWGYSEETKAAGTVASGLDSSSTATSMVCSDASKIGVGDTLLIESEQVFVSERGSADTTADLNDTLTADRNDVTVTVDDGTQINAGETILIDSEKMLVESVTGNDLTVERSVDGSVLAAHTSGANVYAFRSLTIARGINGTTAATHDDDTAISKYAPPADVVEFVTAQSIAHHQQGKSGWTGAIGGDETGVVETRMFNLYAMRQDLLRKYGRVTV